MEAGEHTVALIILFFQRNKSQIKLIKNINLRNESRLIFKDLNHDGILEILTFNDALAYFSDLCFACSPRLPLIICHNKEIFTDCTSSFPELLDKEIEATLRTSVSNDEEGVALKYLALFIIKGKEAEGWVGIKKHYPTSFSWLKLHEDELKHALSKDRFTERLSDNIN